MAIPINADEAAVQSVVAAMPALVDLREWGRLQSCFAPRVTVDYTSLWGGEPQHLRREELLEQWQSLIPGFDATRHQLGSIDANIEGGRAVARVPITACHFLAGQVWSVSGNYRCVLVRERDTWEIAELTFALESEEGDRQLVAQAKEAAAQHAE